MSGAGLVFNAAFVDGRERLGPRVLQREDFNLGDPRDLLGVEALHQLGDAPGIYLAAGDDERVDAFVRRDLHLRGLAGRAGGAVAEQTLHRERDLAHVRLREREDMNGQTVLRRLSVELLDQPLDRAQVLDIRAHEQGVHPRVGDDGDGVVRLAPDARRAVGEDRLQGGLKLPRRGLLQREDAEVQFAERPLAVELREDALDEVEGFLAACHEDGVDAVVGDHGHLHAALVGAHG